MKTTIEIPDSLFRAAKSAASGRGISLKAFLTEALKSKLAEPRRPRAGWPVPPPGVSKAALNRLRSVVDAEFSQVDLETWK